MLLKNLLRLTGFALEGTCHAEVFSDLVRKQVIEYLINRSMFLGLGFNFVSVSLSILGIMNTTGIL